MRESNLRPDDLDIAKTMRAKSRILPVVAVLVGSVAVAVAVWAYWQWATAKHAPPAKPGLPRPEALLKLPYEEFRAKWLQVTDRMEEAQKKQYAQRLQGLTVEWTGFVWAAKKPEAGTTECCGWAVAPPQKGYVVTIRMRQASYWREMALCGVPEEAATKVQKDQSLRFRGTIAEVRWRGKYVGFVLRDVSVVP